MPPLKNARAVAPTTGKVTVYDVQTGAALERWPVDARVLIAAGTHAVAAPGSDTPESPEWAKRIGEPDAPPDVAHTPLGEPVIATRREDASPAAPFVPPAGRTSTGKDRPGRR